MTLPSQFPNRRSFMQLGFSCFASAVIGGCAKWKKDVSSAPMEYARVRLPVDAVILEMSVVQFDEKDAELLNQAWSELDEARFDRHKRSELAANGFRVGVSAQQLPRAIQDLLNSHQERAEDVSAEQKSGEETGQLRTPVRVGHPARMVTSPTYPELSWIVNEKGYLHGRDMTDARCEYIVKAAPSDSGKATISVTPEIRFGAPKQRIGVGNSSLKYEMSQERKEFGFLSIEADLDLGQTLIIAPAVPITGLAGKFLRSSEQTGDRPKFILVRLAQTQMDDLFGADKRPTQIATPTE